MCIRDRQRKVKVRDQQTNHGCQEVYQKPWTTDLKFSRKQLILEKTPQHRLNTKLWKNHCTSLIRSSKATYWQREFQKPNDAKRFWNVVTKFQGEAKSTTIRTLAKTTWYFLNGHGKSWKVAIKYHVSTKKEPRTAAQITDLFPVFSNGYPRSWLLKQVSKSRLEMYWPVSYTHLTLPTIYSE